MKAIPLPTLFAGDRWQSWRHLSDRGTGWPIDTRPSSCHNFYFGHPDCCHTRHDQIRGRISTGHPTLLSSKQAPRVLARTVGGARHKRCLLLSRSATRAAGPKHCLWRTRAWEGGTENRAGGVPLHSLRPRWRDKRITAWDLSRHSLHSS